MTAVSMPLVQVAFSTLDPGRTVTWYRDVLGFLPAGQMRGASGPEVAAMMGLPSVSCDMRWLVDSSDFFQLEFFEFHEPVPQPGVRRPDEIGWSLLGLHVAEFDAVLRRLCQTGTPAGPVRGNAPARRVCCCDPEGVWLELRERGPLPRRTVRDAPVTTTFVRAVVPDLERSRRFFSGALGLRVPQDDPHGCAVELVQYTTRAALPEPANHRLCDQGILNIAFGSRTVADYKAVVAQVSAGGYQVHDELAIGPAAACYLLDDQGFSVELLTIPDPAIERDFGFAPLG